MCIIITVLLLLRHSPCDMIWSQLSYEIGKADSFLFYVELRLITYLPSVGVIVAELDPHLVFFSQYLGALTLSELVTHYVVYPITSDLGLICDLLGCFLLDTFHSWTAKLETCFLLVQNYLLNPEQTFCTWIQPCTFVC